MRTRPALSSAASSPLPALLFMMVMVASAPVNQGVNQKGRLAGGPKAADHNSRPVGSRRWLLLSVDTLYQSSGRSIDAVIALYSLFRTKCDPLNDVGQGR